MTGKLKTKGNMMLATKLGGVLGVRPAFPPEVLLLTAARDRRVPSPKRSSDLGEAGYAACMRHVCIHITTEARKLYDVRYGRRGKA
jgi:hypothetical protein